MTQRSTTGILLVNLGTPDDTRVSSIRRYLKEFLLDPRVIDLPAMVRYLLVFGAILPFRPFKTKKAYDEIWQEEGSPLRIYSESLVEDVQAQLGSGYQVALGMRYGNPSIAKGLKALRACDRIVVVPLFAQYSSAATGSAMAKIMTEAAKLWNVPSISLVNQFYDQDFFIKPYAQLIDQHLPDKDTFLLMSYHGLPERHLDKSQCRATCDRQVACPIMASNNTNCYRAQCYASSKAIVQALGIESSNYMVSFQSRLGRIPWIKPYTDEVLPKLYEQGVRDLAVVCPAFVADCLETLEEIGLQAKEQWHELGGERFTLIPCLNVDPLWVSGLSDWLRSL